MKLFLMHFCIFIKIFRNYFKNQLKSRLMDIRFKGIFKHHILHIIYLFNYYISAILIVYTIYYE